MGGRRSGPVVGHGWRGGGGRMEEVETLQWTTTLSDPWSSGLIIPVLFSLLLSISPPPLPFPGSAFYHSVFSPLAFLILFPSPSSSFFFFLSLSVSDFHSPSAAQGMFSFQMRAKKSCDKVVCVCVFVCVYVLGLSVMQPWSWFIYYSPPYKSCFG